MGGVPAGDRPVTATLPGAGHRSADRGPTLGRCRAGPRPLTRPSPVVGRPAAGLRPIRGPPVRVRPVTDNRRAVRGPSTPRQLAAVPSRTGRRPTDDLLRIASRLTPDRQSADRRRWGHRRGTGRRLTADRRAIGGRPTPHMQSLRMSRAPYAPKVSTRSGSTGPRRIGGAPPGWRGSRGVRGRPASISPAGIRARSVPARTTG